MTPRNRSNRKEQNVNRSPLIDGLFGESELIQQVRQDIELAASVDDMNVLIIGEPGTGKELVARGIHKASRRAKKPFVSINFAAINHTLIENEFFGFENGALIPASARTPGLLMSADGGTLFLDEIGDLSPESQALLLALLREREYENAGWKHALKIDIRLIVATNHDLSPEVAAERFRPGLYDRINEFPIRTPPLREHPTDIPILIQSYFHSIEFDEASLKILCRYYWPGNVRQLISTVERLAVKAGGERIITADHVRREIDLERKSELATAPGDRFPAPREGETLKEYICRAVLAVYEMERANWGNHSAAAHRLGMNRTTLYDWLEWARQHVTK